MNNDFLLNIDQNVAGLIWITENSLTSKEDYFKEIDYLLDGLILNELQDQQEIKFSTSLFLSKSFNQSFFVIHTTLGAKELEKQLQICPKSTRSIIKVLNNTSKEINLSHSDYTFKNIL